MLSRVFVSGLIVDRIRTERWIIRFKYNIHTWRDNQAKGDDGVVPGEKAMPADADAGGNSSSSAAPAQIEPDEMILTQLLTMGFSENGCKRACIAVNNAGVEQASEWVFAHMEDPDFNDPPAPPAPAAGGKLKLLSIAFLSLEYC